MEKNSRKLNLLWWIPLLFIGIGVASLLCCFYKLGFTDLIFTEDFRYYGVYKIVIVASIVLIASSFVFLILSLVFKRKNTVQIIICIAMALCYVGILTPTVINSVNLYKSVEINYYTKSDIKNISILEGRELNIKVMKQDDTTIVIANTNDNNDEFCYHYIDSQNENLYMQLESNRMGINSKSKRIAPEITDDAIYNERDEYELIEIDDIYEFYILPYQDIYAKASKESYSNIEDFENDVLNMKNVINEFA